MQHLRPAATEAALALVVLVGAVATAWWRLGAVTRGTAWAEDGGLFLRERLAYGVDGTSCAPTPATCTSSRAWSSTSPCTVRSSSTR